MDVHDIIFIGQQQKGSIDPGVRETRKKTTQNT